MTVFILFNRLPIEVQLAVWKLAARADNKCAHFLTVEQSDNRVLTISGSWDEESGFIKDAGIWKACGESQDVCLKSYCQLQRG